MQLYLNENLNKDLILGNQHLGFEVIQNVEPTFKITFTSFVW